MSESQDDWLSRPQLEWHDGEARHQNCADAYFSEEGGRAESSYVFLDGNNLAQRFADCQGFVLGELGFGTGLNMLMSWQLWRQHAPACARLDMFSVEAEPMSAEQMRQALRAWPELAADLDVLCAKLPAARRGFHSLQLDPQVCLHLLYGDVNDVLAQWSEPADAWFLDGFAPSRNSAMWSPQVLTRVAQLTQPGGSFATYTAAGHVRRALISAGFEVHKRKGFGRKRDMLVGHQTAQAVPPRRWLAWPELRNSSHIKPRPSIAIIGAGLAGSCLASELAHQGQCVSLFGPASSYSTRIPAMLVRPYPEKTRSISHRLHAHAFDTACDFYAQHAGAAWKTHRLVTPQGEQKAGAIVCEALLQNLSSQAHIERQATTVSTAIYREGRWSLQLADATEVGDFDALILCTAELPRSLKTLGRISPCAGQVIIVDGEMPQPIAADVHALPMAGATLWGSSYRAQQNRCDIREDDTSELLAKARVQNPALEHANVLSAHASLRQTTPDHLPLVGPTPDPSQWQTLQIQHMRQRDPAKRSAAPYLDGLWLNLAHGSRAATMAPLAARLIARALNGQVLGLEAELLDAIHPGRFLSRQIKRGEALPEQGKATQLWF